MISRSINLLYTKTLVFVTYPAMDLNLKNLPHDASLPKDVVISNVT
jgi:hypothetical protein